MVVMYRSCKKVAIFFQVQSDILLSFLFFILFLPEDQDPRIRSMDTIESRSYPDPLPIQNTGLRDISPPPPIKRPEKWTCPHENRLAQASYKKTGIYIGGLLYMS